MIKTAAAALAARIYGESSPKIAAATPPDVNQKNTPMGNIIKRSEVKINFRITGLFSGWFMIRFIVIVFSFTVKNIRLTKKKTYRAVYAYVES